MDPTPFPSDEPIRIEIETGRNLAEVFLIDHGFRLIERGVGSLAARVSPGVYKVKAHLGAVTFEELMVLNRDRVGEDRIDLSPRVGVLAPAPMPGPALARGFQADLAATESRSVDIEAGSGAEIFLMTRRRSGPQEPASEAELTGLTLLDSGGGPVADLFAAKLPTASPGGAPAAGATVAIDPGPYSLRWSDSSGVAAEQSIYAIPGWQTQVFLVEDGPGPDGHRHHNVSVQLSREAFDPGDPTLALVEEARAALAEERKVATGAINESLFGDFENPMLGLFGAHLMLVAETTLRREDAARERLGEDTATAPSAPVQFDQDLFERVVARLRELLGPTHPDVVALGTRSRRHRIELPVIGPPLLWKSWQLLIEASNRTPHLVPAELWRETLGALPLRPFFVWSPMENRREMAQRWEDQIAETLARTGQRRLGRFYLGEDPRERLSRELMVPRAVIDAQLPPEEPFSVPSPVQIR